MYNIRYAINDDHHFIASTLQSAMLFGTNISDIFQFILTECEIYILTPQTDDDLICACAVIYENCLVWLYTKQIYRKAGIATFLLNHIKPQKFYFLKGHNKLWKKMEKKHHLKWNPYLILNTQNCTNP